MPKGGNAGAVNSPETNRALNFRPQQPPLQNNNMMAPWGPSNPMQMMGQMGRPQMQFPGQTPPIQPQQGGIGGMMGLNPMLIQFLQMLNQQQQLNGGGVGQGGMGGVMTSLRSGGLNPNPNQPMARPQPVPMGEQPASDFSGSPIGPSPNLMGRFLGRKVFEQ